MLFLCTATAGRNDFICLNVLTVPVRWGRVSYPEWQISCPEWQICAHKDSETTFQDENHKKYSLYGIFFQNTSIDVLQVFEVHERKKQTK